jgi:peptidyl-prolyl cis-trans isomerase SurA
MLKQFSKQVIGIFCSLVFAFICVQALAKTVNNNSKAILVAVGEAPISSRDVYNRSMLIINSTDLPNTPETFAQLHNKVLEMLVDEVLITQEMKRLKINVGEVEIQEAFTTVAERNGIPEQQLQQFLKSKGIDLQELRKQMIVQLGWAKIINQNIRAHLHVNEQEIAENRLSVKKIAENESKVFEYRLAEIILLAQSAQEHQTNINLAQDLLQKVADGAKFGKLAQQFSQSESAKSFGEIGWVSSAQVHPELKAVLSGLEVGGTDLIVHPDTVQVVKILDKRLLSETSNKELSDEEVGNYLMNRKTSIAIKSYLKNLRKNTYIQFFQ